MADLIKMKDPSSPKSILSISYDEPLLLTREWMLKAQGYEVTSAIGFTEALLRCNCYYDLAIIGHSIPRQDKLALIAEIKKRCRAQVLSIVRHGEQGLSEADGWVDAIDGPEALLHAVQKILGSPVKNSEA